MIKNLISAIGFGLVFGIGFVLGRVTEPFPLYIPQFSEIKKEKILQEVQEKLKLSYFTELLKKPSEEAPISDEPEPTTEQNVPAPLPSPTQAPDRMAQALAKVLGQETPDAVKSVIKSSLPEGTGSPYAIQVASLPKRKDAEDWVRRLKRKGHFAQLVQAELPGRGTLYRVRIHGFKTRAEADLYRSKEKIVGITVGQ